MSRHTGVGTFFILKMRHETRDLCSFLIFPSPSPVSSGYVGAGMLSAAVAGGVFASPPPASILAAILSLHNAGKAL